MLNFRLGIVIHNFKNMKETDSKKFFNEKPPAYYMYIIHCIMIQTRLFYIIKYQIRNKM